MKNNFFILIMLLSVQCFGQDYYTLVAKSYIIMKDGKEKKLNKSMVLTYSRDYSMLYIEDEKNISFPNEQYTRDLIEGQLHESYLSGETSTSLYGRYNIQIFHKKDQNIFEVVLPGVTFYAEHAELFSENGKVLHNPYVENWKELVDKEVKRKSIEKQKSDSIKVSIAKAKIADSLEVIKRDKLKQIEIENNLQSGNNYNEIGKNTEILLNDTLKKYVELKKDETIYSSWIIKIDKEGFITKAYPDDNYKGGHIISSYIPVINGALINQNVKSIFFRNGKSYPSYSSFYVFLSYTAKGEKKRINIKNPLKKLPLGSFLNVVK